jgi:hypothetical protein
MKTDQKTRTLNLIYCGDRALSWKLLESKRAKRVVKFLRGRGRRAYAAAIVVKVGGAQDTTRRFRDGAVK